MLEYLRNASEKPIAKILIGILAFSFVGWGVAEWIFGGAAGDNAVAHVGGTEISAQQFNAEKSREMAQLSRDEQRKVYADATSQNEFTQKVLAELVTNQMTENRAQDLGFVVSDKRIAQEIRDFPEFQVNGQFSTLAFDTVLNNSGYSEAQFADVLRGQVLRSMVLGAMSVAVPVPNFVVQSAYDARYGKREIEYAVVPYSEFKVAAPTDEQLKAFYEQNSQIVPETRSVSYVLVAADTTSPDSYDKGYASAVKVEDDIIAGETMEDAAKKHGAKYVTYDAFARAGRPVDKLMTDNMVAKIFDMDEGLESEMIETDDGFLFVRVDKINPEHKADFESVKGALVSDWTRAEQKKQAYVKANEYLVDLKKDGKLENKKSVTVTRMSGAPNDVLVAAFRDGVGSKTLVEGADAFYVLSVNNAVAPQVDKQKMADLQNEMQNMSDNGVKEDYNSFLKREYPIEINEKVYNRLIVK